ncbi:MAG: hypothetical protein ACXVB9_19925 [Bdellovibrionota bacterium]
MKMCLVFVALVLSSCSMTETRVPSSAEENYAGVRELSGIIAKDKTDRFQRYAFRDQGAFLISTAGFTARTDAIAFCAGQQGYRLSTWILPGVLTMQSLPFTDLRRNNIVEDNVIDGGDEGAASGVLFWVVGKDDKEEAQFKPNTDLIYTMLNGCGPGCDAVVRLSVVNAKLKKLGKAAISPRAICTSNELEASLQKD